MSRVTDNRNNVGSRKQERYPLLCPATRGDRLDESAGIPSPATIPDRHCGPCTVARPCRPAAALYCRRRPCHRRRRHVFIPARRPADDTDPRSNFGRVAMEMSEFPELGVVSRRAAPPGPVIAARRPRERLVSAGRLSK